MTRYVYLLTITDAGHDIGPGWETNFAFVVVAGTTWEARKHAAEAAIDEPPMTWKQAKYSTCRKIGPCTNGRIKSGILAREDNAS